MLTVKTVRFKGIGRFVEMQEIHFDRYGHLVQIDGINKNTGGSSGAAKSTICNAFDFLFGLNAIPNTELQSRLTDEHIFVEMDADLDGQPLTVSRSKKLKITLNGETVTGSAKLTEEKLDQVLAIPRELFRPMLHKKQGEKGFFLGFKPSEMNSFLTDLLGLSDFKNKINNLDIKIAELSMLSALASSSLEASKAALEASSSAKIALGSPPVKEVDQDAILKLKTFAETAESELKAILTSHKIEEDNLIEGAPKTIIIDTELKDRSEKEIESLRKFLNQAKIDLKEEEHRISMTSFQQLVKVKELESIRKKGDDAKAEATVLAAEVKKIRDNKCPRCEQIWTSDTAKIDEARLLAKISELGQVFSAGQEAMRSLEGQYKALDDINSKKPEHSFYARIADLEHQVQSKEDVLKEENERYSKHNREQEVKQGEFTSKLKELKKRHELESQQLRGQADVSRKRLESAVATMRNHAEAVSRYAVSLEKLLAQEKGHAEKTDAAQASLSELRSKLDTLEELKRAMKSYLSCSFDEILEVIGDNATKMIRGIPNMQNATIQLQGIRETKEGKVKEEVNAVIHMDGEEDIPLRTLSGGEKASVDLAIDLSVLNLIEERTNKGINLFFLDEPFTGLESVNIEMVLEVLKNANVNKKIFIIDHNPVVKEQISDRIMVVRDSLTSRIEPYV